MLLMGPSGVGKSRFLRQALMACGSGLVLACPGDELDSYAGLESPAYCFKAIDDSTYTPTLKEDKGAPTGLRDGMVWLKQRYAEVVADVGAGKLPRYAVLGLDTVSAMGTLAQNAAMAQYSRTEPPAAMSPDGAAYYTYLRMKQEEIMRLARAFRGYGVHLIALCHELETEIGDDKIAKVLPGKTKMIMPSVPGAFRTMLPSFFSTVLHAGVMLQTGKAEPAYYVTWASDPKRPTKNRFGPLGPNEKIVKDWLTVSQAVEKAALEMGGQVGN